jgi:hypothetical protein
LAANVLATLLGNDYTGWCTDENDDEDEYTSGTSHSPPPLDRQLGTSIRDQLTGWFEVRRDLHDLTLAWRVYITHRPFTVAHHGVATLTVNTKTAK